MKYPALTMAAVRSMDLAADVRRSQQLCRRIDTLLAGQDPSTIGCVLAELMADHIIRFTAAHEGESVGLDGEDAARVRDLFLELVRQRVVTKAAER